MSAAEVDVEFENDLGIDVSGLPTTLHDQRPVDPEDQRWAGSNNESSHSRSSRSPSARSTSPFASATSRRSAPTSPPTSRLRSARSATSCSCLRLLRQGSGHHRAVRPESLRGLRRRTETGPATNRQAANEASGEVTVARDRAPRWLPSRSSCAARRAGCRRCSTIHVASRSRPPPASRPTSRAQRSRKTARRESRRRVRRRPPAAGYVDAPGSYKGQITVGDSNLPAVVEVVPKRRLRADPSRLMLAGGAAPR